MNQTTKHWTSRAKPTGFTLVELLVALTMGAMLLAAIVGVLRSVNQQLNIALRESKETLKSSILELFYNDFLNASAISSSGGWIWLEGVFPTFSGDAVITKRIGYHCVPWIKQGQSALVRLGDGQGELVSVGPRRLLIERLDSTNTPQPLSQAPTPIPSRLRLWLWETDTEEATLVKDFVLR